MPAAAAESCRANLVHLTPTHIWFGLKVWFQGLLPEHVIDCPRSNSYNIYIIIHFVYIYISRSNRHATLLSFALRAAYLCK